MVRLPNMERGSLGDVINPSPNYKSPSNTNSVMVVFKKSTLVLQLQLHLVSHIELIPLPVKVQIKSIHESMVFIHE